MFSPKLHYLNISDYLSFYENDNTVFKGSSSKLINQPIHFFENIPLSGWKLSYKSFIPFNGVYSVPSYFLTHPTNPDISFACQDIFDKIPFINLQSGVILNKIIIVSEGWNISFVFEGTPEFDLALSLLSNSSTKASPKDLSVGDVVLFKSSHKPKNGFTFLGKAFLTSLNFSKANVYYSQYKSSFNITPSSKISYFFSFSEKDFDYIFAVPSLKDLQIIDFNPSLIDFNIVSFFNEKKDSYNVLDFSFKKTYPNYTWFLSDSLFPIEESSIPFLSDYFNQFQLTPIDFSDIKFNINSPSNVIQTILSSYNK